jgi:hypothetical protein
MKLIFKHKFSCGNHRYYPNCKISAVLGKIKGSPSLNEEEIFLLNEVGFDVELQSFEDTHVEEMKKKITKKKEKV